MIFHPHEEPRTIDSDDFSEWMRAGWSDSPEKALRVSDFPKPTPVEVKRPEKPPADSTGVTLGEITNRNQKDVHIRKPVFLWECPSCGRYYVSKGNMVQHFNRAHRKLAIAKRKKLIQQVYTIKKISEDEIGEFNRRYQPASASTLEKHDPTFPPDLGQLELPLEGKNDIHTVKDSGSSVSKPQRPFFVHGELD